jgi:hypothetical protein
MTQRAAGFIPVVTAGARRMRDTALINRAARMAGMLACSFEVF